MNSTLKLNEAAAEQETETESVASPKSALSKLPFLSSGANETESQLPSESIDNYLTPELQYVSPFKSRKPHRELKVLNISDHMTDLNYSKTDFQGVERNDVNTDEMLLLSFNKTQLEKYERQHIKLDDQLRRKNEKIKAHIRNTGNLPVVDAETNSLIDGNILGDFDESYFDETMVFRGANDTFQHLQDRSQSQLQSHIQSPSQNHRQYQQHSRQDHTWDEEHSLTEHDYKNMMRENMITIPHVSPESLRVYCDSLDMESKLSSINISSSSHTKTLAKEYASLSSPKLEPLDLKLYRSFTKLKLNMPSTLGTHSYGVFASMAEATAENYNDHDNNYDYDSGYGNRSSFGVGSGRYGHQQQQSMNIRMLGQPALDYDYTYNFEHSPSISSSPFRSPNRGHNRRTSTVHLTHGGRGNQDYFSFNREQEHEPEKAYGDISSDSGTGATLGAGIGSGVGGVVSRLPAILANNLSTDVIVGGLRNDDILNSPFYAEDSGLQDSSNDEEIDEKAQA
ncbi:unnamed protein product [Ambrosiozyma monospora]|uniref:Unnamed protein product n=1 Tax=Ambrosiozyma monospora TaxID=43982 RepID=A0ACB5TB39_AMBMO|nr:unnamed protein product [Ambrosiozyma monospora]